MDLLFFQKAADYVLQNEGGYSNIPEDGGGPTNFGITQHDLSEFRGEQVSANDVRMMSVDEARTIYKKFYWNKISGDSLTQLGVATCIFDCSVLYGIHEGSKYAQLAANNCGSLIEPDGKIGPETIKVLNSVKQVAFVQAYHLLVRAKINAIIESRPSQEIFRKGWESRANRLLTLA